jgi:hypothetical protein
VPRWLVGRRHGPVACPEGLGVGNPCPRRPPDACRDPPPEGGWAAVEEIVFRPGGQCGATIADLHQPQRRAHRPQRSGWTYFHLPSRPTIPQRSTCSPPGRLIWKFFHILAQIPILCFESFGIGAGGKSRPGERQPLRSASALRGMGRGSSDMGEAIRSLPVGPNRVRPCARSDSTRQLGLLGDLAAQASASSSALASWRSAVSKPSVNQP